MSASDVLVDVFGRIQELVDQTVEGLSAEQLAYRVDRRANSIAWLVWHLTRIQDDHIAQAAGVEQVWHSAGWMDRFGLPFDRDATGYGQSSDEVAEVRPASPDLLTGYHHAVHDQTVGFVATLRDSELARVVDKRWDPPVTLGVRLVSVVCDDLEHVGQAAYVRGLTERR
ncbi:MAG TPA: DUF664 domain-containing protein [Mycobacteriales bacterium]|nr:DUF664 domain-containing protein [Mycobacteriales bacterium]